MRTAIVVLAGALLMTTSTGAFAEQTQAEKDECLLVSQNCKDQVDDIYKRIERLDREIRKGTRVYSPKELEKLRQKLTETQETLRSMEKPGQ